MWNFPIFFAGSLILFCFVIIHNDDVLEFNLLYLILLNILLKIVVVVVIDFPHTNLNLFANVYPLLQYYTTTINLPVMCTFQVSPWSEEFRAIQLRRLTYQRFQSCKFENSGDLIILGQSRYPFKPPNENKLI